MPSAVRDDYLASQVLTAPPQRLHLLLLEGAIRFGNQALARWEAGDKPGGDEALGRCRDIVAELLAGLKPSVAPELVRDVGARYLWVFRRLVEAKQERSAQNVRDVLGVLREERQTWQLLCERLAADENRSSDVQNVGPESSGLNLSV
ncbi:MAG: flagellar protein FliS [Planctomycetia bacterium]|nr:flagellar protein FliS [Planctomycetia bacterium]